jgi:two-component system sensor histidine kinase DesK
MKPSVNVSSQAGSDDAEPCEAMTAGPSPKPWGNWGGGWRRYLFPGIWLVYLGETAGGIADHSSGVATIAGYVMLLAFCVAYLIALGSLWDPHRSRMYRLLALLIALCIAETPIAHETSFVMCVFIAVIVIGAFSSRYAVPVIAAMTAVVLFLPPMIPSWHAEVDYSDGFALVMVTFAMVGFFAIIRTNRALAEARSEVARLAAENERSRIARDLHDLLGHSLTTITVKAGLARRLADIDPARAAVEIAEVEQLARRSLTEVRAAVAGYRDVTLTGELATSREVLRAAGITAAFPGATDNVDPSLHELFGWVVREGITNTVRHSRASRCEIEVGPNWIEISDDGGLGPSRSSAADSSGSGLAGLTERVALAGGTLDSGRRDGIPGWFVRVEVPLAGQRLAVAAAANLASERR